ncbi:MAG TPA: Ig-like domain-containing protein, partial [Kofleriaceae bacterium]|nr:Ig-like domain-containing protein [Kofleriaceae bacterium]
MATVHWRFVTMWWCAVLTACGSGQPATPPQPVHVVLTSPHDHELDVPLGSRIVVSFSGAVPDGVESAAQILGPAGPVAIATKITGGGKTLELGSSELDPGTPYEVDVPGATFHFTTRDDRPHVGPPRLIAFAGADPASAVTIRDTATLELVFSEPLDPRSVVQGDAAIELVDTTTGLTVPATLLANGIHVALAPAAPLIAGDAYELVLGGQLLDTGGEAFAATTIAFTPVDTLGSGPIAQHFRIRQPGDPMPDIARTDASNTIAIVHPLIGSASAAISPGAIDAALGDPAALGGPIAFTIPKGQRFAAAGLEIALGGAVPSGLTTGDIAIELVTTGGGVIEHNAFSDASPDNTDAPLRVELDLDVAVYASDPTGNAVLAQTLLGVQLDGIA